MNMTKTSIAVALASAAMSGSAATPRRGPLYTSGKALYKKLLTICAAAMLLSPLSAWADAYQFIIFGDPIAAATAGTSSLASPGTSFVTSTLKKAAVAPGIESRILTWFSSVGVNIDPDKILGFKLIFR